MTLAYRVLGLAAGLGRKLSRISVNFVRLNWLAMLALGFLVTFGTQQTKVAWANRDGPRKQGVVDAIRQYDPARSFVTVRGTLVPVTLFKKAATRRSGGETIQYSVLPLVHPDTGETLLVQVPGSHADRNEPVETEVTGTLAPMERDLRGVLLRTKGKVEDLQVNTELVLVADQAPGSFTLWGGATALAAVALLAMLSTWRKRYVVFRSAPEDDSAAPATAANRVADNGIDLRASGRFRLDAKNRAHFVAVPAGLVRLDDGRFAVVCNVDASANFMGVTTRQRRGVWAVAIEAQDLARLERGFQYLWARQRWALRVAGRDIETGREETILLSCADRAERTRLEHALVEMVETSVEPAPAPGAREELVAQS